MFYFNSFPTVNYQIGNGEKTVAAIDITKRFRIIEDFMKNQYVFYTYVVKEEETARMIADKYYGDIRLDWLVYMINDMHDPFLDWPLGYYEMENLIRFKYGSLEAAKQTTAEYYRILSPREVLIDGTILPERKVLIDQTAYLLLPDEDRSKISQYDLEKQKNEDKRTIKLVDKAYISILLQEFKKVFD